MITAGRTLLLESKIGPVFSSLLVHVFFLAAGLIVFDLRELFFLTEGQGMHQVELLSGVSPKKFAPGIPGSKKILQAQAGKKVAAPVPPTVEPDGIDGESGRIEVKSVSGSGGELSVWDRYKAELAAWLNRLKRYPSVALKEKQTGLAVVEFLVDTDGSFKDPHLVQSTGFGLLDQEAVALIDRAHKFRVFPENIHQGSVTFRIPIEFKMN